MGRQAQKSPAEHLLEIKNLTKRFPSVIANDRVNLEVDRGEIHCLLGENGAGKSTLAECIYGYYQPEEGEICFKGKKVAITSPNEAIKLGIGMVHQHFGLVAPFSVVENMALGLDGSTFRLHLNQVEKELEVLCKEYDIKIDFRAKISQLSVGEQQWVEILKALYGGVDLLILDEPTAVLTPQETEKFFAILKKMTNDGIAVIFITHKLKEVMQVSDKVTILRQGKVVGTVETKEVNRRDLARMMVGREVIFRVEKSEIPRGAPVLEVDDLWARNDRGRDALRGVTFTLHKNEILGLAGVAGNGQKELIETLVGVRRATRGKVLVEGVDVNHSSPRVIMSKGLGHIPDDRIREGLITDFSVAENLVLGLHRERNFRKGLFLDTDRINQYAGDCVASFEIATTSLENKTKFLSGGNLQKVILARELGMQPKILLANQPTRGLDVGVMEYVWKKLLEKREHGDGVLLASEDLDEILGLADRIMVIYDGQITGVFDVDDVEIEEIGLLMAGVGAEE